jgi:hypothetical protein
VCVKEKREIINDNDIDNLYVILGNPAASGHVAFGAFLKAHFSALGEEDVEIVQFETVVPGWTHPSNCKSVQKEEVD